MRSAKPLYTKFNAAIETGQFESDERRGGRDFKKYFSVQFISSDEINLTFGASAVRVGRRLELTGSWPGQRLARLSLTHLSLNITWKVRARPSSDPGEASQRK